MTKEYYGNHFINILIGVIGLLAFIVGTLMLGLPCQKVFFLVGSILLTISSYLEKNIFFTVIEGIATIDAILTFTLLSNTTIAIITFIIVILTVLYFVAKGAFKERYLIIGTVGLFFLAMGVGTLNPIAYTLGGFFLVIYSYFSFRKGSQIALLFIILNSIFTLTSAIAVYEWLISHNIL
jgi:hypothetical protein